MPDHMRTFTSLQMFKGMDSEIDQLPAVPIII
jgi:hypothetical protein